MFVADTPPDRHVDLSTSTYSVNSALSPLGFMSNNTKLRGENHGPKPV